MNHNFPFQRDCTGKITPARGQTVTDTGEGKMVYLYLCHYCQKGKHGQCETVTPGKPEYIGGGRICTCGCKGHEPWPPIPEGMNKLKLVEGNLEDFLERQKRLTSKRLVIRDLTPIQPVK